MRKALIIVVSVLLIASMSAPAAVGANSMASADRTAECAFPVTVEDASGTEITVEEPPERVVTTIPSAAQIMKEIGAFDQVVGLSEHALYLDGAEERTIISDDEGWIELEKVIEAEPDLVLAPNATPPETVEQMRDAGLTVYHFPMEESLDDVFESTRQVGELVGACDGAEETMQWMDEELAIVEKAIDGADRPDALYVSFGFTAGGSTFINEIIQAGGAENIAERAGIEGYQPIDEEVVIDEDPDWIILDSNDPGLPDSDAINETTAAQNDQTVVVQVEHFNQPAPRNVLAIKTLVEHFHPEAYESAQEAAHANDSDDDGDGANDADDTDDTAGVTEDPAEDDPIPGFGPVVAIVGLAAALVTLMTRRDH